MAAAVGPMPADRRAALAALLGPDGSTAARSDQIATVVELGLDVLMTSAVEAGVAAALALARTANEASADPEAARALDRAAFAALLLMEQDGTLSATQAKAVLADLLEAAGTRPSWRAPAASRPSGPTPLVAVVDDLIAAHPDEWARYLGGDEKEAGKLAGFFIGQAMKATRG